MEAIELFRSDILRHRRQLNESKTIQLQVESPTPIARSGNETPQQFYWSDYEKYESAKAVVR